MSEWRALGVTPQGRTLPDNTLATLIEPDGPQATAGETLDVNNTVSKIKEIIGAIFFIKFFLIGII